ncbi:MAG: hypothetical protein EZS28_014344 [Streblomastix strix]|uniref:Uncharacterized protein n=1 Tax=Streblomastix strix TaxID=222440 RepID=A0A5J4W5H5_9EUKA|nr:MAG: hypothetical protein EZS28_014344 [Streblomastix strix]
MNEKKLEVKQILTGKTNVILVSAKTWQMKGRRKSVLQDLKKIKTLAGAALSMFSDTCDGVQFSIVQTIVKTFYPNYEQKSRYKSVQNLSQLKRFILSEGHREVIVKIRKNPKEFEIIFMRGQSICSPVVSEEKKLSAMQCTKDMNEEIWLRKMWDDIGVDQEFAGSSVRNAMIIKKRKEGATQEEVNEATRHAPGSNTCDIFYNKPVTRDLGTLILKDSEPDPLVGTHQAQVPCLAGLVAVRLVNWKRNKRCPMKTQ